MELLKFSVITILALATRICFAGLVTETSKVDKSELVEATIDILESCYKDRISTVGLAGPSVGSIMSQMSSRDTIIPVTLIDEISRVENHAPVNRGSRYKLQLFVITTCNQSALVKTLNQVRRSKWWNHMASFFLIDFSVVENGCFDIAETLYGAWFMNLLNSKLVCLHRTRGPLIYTFNPYTSKAPVPWQRENTYTALDGHIWTLFVREYREVESRCVRLDFDKTVDLGGHEVRASVHGMEYWWSDDPNVNIVHINRIMNVTAQILISSLNATWKLRAQPWNDNGLLNSDMNETFGVAAEVTSGISDVCLNIVNQPLYINFETTNSLYRSHMGFLTQYPGYKTQLEKIISVLDRSSRFGVVVVLLITLLFFKFWLGRPLILAALDLMLIVCNAALHRIPERLAPRIYLCTLFIFVVTMQGIYQGQFAALLTKEVRLPPIDTIEDLARSNYTIYGQPEFRIIFNQSAFGGRYVDSPIMDCLTNVMLDSKAACVSEVIGLTSDAVENDLHLSRESLGQIYGAYLIRPDWPLEERVNMIFRQAVAGGIIETVYSRERENLIKRLEFYENREQESGPKVLNLKHLRFAFVILGIGLLCATIIFIIEVATFGKVVPNPRRCIRNMINREHP